MKKSYSILVKNVTHANLTQSFKAFFYLKQEVTPKGISCTLLVPE